MSRQSPTKAQAKITELWWSRPSPPRRPGPAPIEQDYVDHLSSVLWRSRSSDAVLAVKADLSVTCQLAHLLCDESRIFAEGGDESAPDTLLLGCRVDGVSDGR